MIALLLFAAASPAPVLYSAEPQSIAFRECVAAERHKSPAATVADIGGNACAHARSRLVAEVRARISFGWAATARTASQARRLRAHMRQEAEAQVAAFETRLQAWLAGGGVLDGGR